MEYSKRYYRNRGLYDGIKMANKPLREVPYLPIDQDVGRTYEAIIRINSPSGKREGSPTRSEGRLRVKSAA